MLENSKRKGSPPGKAPEEEGELLIRRMEVRVGCSADGKRRRRDSWANFWVSLLRGASSGKEMPREERWWW